MRKNQRQITTQITPLNNKPRPFSTTPQQQPQPRPQQPPQQPPQPIPNAEHQQVVEINPLSLLCVLGMGLGTYQVTTIYLKTTGQGRYAIPDAPTQLSKFSAMDYVLMVDESMDKRMVEEDLKLRHDFHQQIIALRNNPDTESDPTPFMRELDLTNAAATIYANEAAESKRAAKQQQSNNARESAPAWMGLDQQPTVHKKDAV